MTRDNGTNRHALPIVDRQYIGLTTYDANDPDLDLDLDLDHLITPKERLRIAMARQ